MLVIPSFTTLAEMPFLLLLPNEENQKKLMRKAVTGQNLEYPPFVTLYLITNIHGTSKNGTGNSVCRGGIVKQA